MAKKQTEETGGTATTPIGSQPPVLNDEEPPRPANYEGPKAMNVERVRLDRVLVFWDADAPLRLTDTCTVPAMDRSRLTLDEVRRLKAQVKHFIEMPKGLVPGETIYLASNRLVVV